MLEACLRRPIFSRVYNMRVLLEFWSALWQMGPPGGGSKKHHVAATTLVKLGDQTLNDKR